jgi:H+-transporting ATPase
MSSLGLTSVEAQARLTKLGPNSTADVSAHPIRSALNKFWAPVPWMLEAVIFIELYMHNYGAAIAFGFIIDMVKTPIFAHLKLT